MAIQSVLGDIALYYGSPMVKDFLISNACFWAEVYHADGLRMDDVDAMLYLGLWQKIRGEWTPKYFTEPNEKSGCSGISEASEFCDKGEKIPDCF